MRLIRSEFLKIRTTNVWWLFSIGALGLLLVAFALNAFQMHFVMDSPSEMTSGGDPEVAAQLSAMTAPVALTSYMVTSGQYFGMMFVMLIGIITVTNEFYHQTATTTFLATPHRSTVVLAKAAVGGLFGIVLWLVTTAITIPATVVYLNAEGITPALGDGAVIRAILLNGLAYALWALIGIGIGVLIRSQIGATISAMVVYTVGTFAVSIIVSVLHNLLHWDWIDNIQWAMPSLASTLMTSGTDVPGQPHYWVGALVLLAWALVTGLIGTILTRTRDVS
ncbi:ABC transporter permease subunit [Catellatospora sp. KI3]|uniref:ABC transporter permease subunit n=1 Tax=Catellatospora sp. KI3 TaxID=3041620 RepID=UPI002482399A|nr:ABC transporter permease subunit [Catellatospora sp. KI3]MDI1466344.1 ABC transporter permease subunit [Catellatospora sp. KI3]